MKNLFGRKTKEEAEKHQTTDIKCDRRRRERVGQKKGAGCLNRDLAKGGAGGGDNN